MRSGLALGFCFFFYLSSSCFGVDPSSLKLKIYAVWMSTSAYCTNPVQVFTASDPLELNFLGNPSLGSLDNNDSAADGTYKCFIIQMSEAIKYVPSSNNGYCVQGTEYTSRICASPMTTIHPDTSEIGTCQDGSITNDTVFLYLSTGSTASDISASTNPFLPPTSSITTRGINLSQSIVVNGNASAKFLVDAFGKIESFGTTCRLNTPLFSMVSTN